MNALLLPHRPHLRDENNNFSARCWTIRRKPKDSSLEGSGLLCIPSILFALQHTLFISIWILHAHLPTQHIYMASAKNAVSQSAVAVGLADLQNGKPHHTRFSCRFEKHTP